MKISLILEAINRWSGPVDAARAATARLGAAVRQLGGAMAGAASSGAARLGAGMRVLGERVMDVHDRVRDAGYQFRKLVGEEGMASAQRSIGYFRNQLSGLAGAFTLLKYATGAALVGLGEEFVRGVFRAGGAAQQMTVTLTRLEGSAAKARAAMAWMQNFGMGPGASMSMDDIMRSYQMAKNFGMNPQGGSLAAFADLAAGERVQLKQVLYAVKDAMEGTSTRPLANLGIKMKQGRKAGEDNSYLYTNLAGQWVTEHSAKTPEAVLTTLVRIISAKYAGLATQQAATVPGGIEQLKKLLYLFQMKVASSGVMDWALKRMNEFFAYIRKAAADGSLDRLAKQISDFITGSGDAIIGFFKDTDWKAVGSDLRVFAGILGTLAGAFRMLDDIGGGGISGLLNLFVASKIIGITGALIGLAPAIAEVATVLLGFDVAAAPIVAVIAIIGALALAGYLLWANWSRISGWFQSMWQDMPRWAQIGVKDFLLATNPLLALPSMIMAAWNALPAFFKGIANWWNGSWMSQIPTPHLPGFGPGDPGAVPAPAGARGAGAKGGVSEHKITMIIQQDGQPGRVIHQGDGSLELRRGPVGGGQ